MCLYAPKVHTFDPLKWASEVGEAMYLRAFKKMFMSDGMTGCVTSKCVGLERGCVSLLCCLVN